MTKMRRIHENKGIDYGIQILITTYELHNPWNQKKKKKKKENTIQTHWSSGRKKYCPTF